MLRDRHGEAHHLRADEHAHPLQVLAVGGEELRPLVAHAQRRADRRARVDEELEGLVAEDLHADLVERGGAELAAIVSRDGDEENAALESAKDEGAVARRELELPIREHFASHGHGAEVNERRSEPARRSNARRLRVETVPLAPPRSPGPRRRAARPRSIA